MNVALDPDVQKFIEKNTPMRGGVELVRVVHGARDLRQVFRRRK